MYVCVQIHINIYIYIYIYISIHLHTYIHIYIYIYIHVHIQYVVGSGMVLHINIDVIHMKIYVYKYVYIYIYIYIKVIQYYMGARYVAAQVVPFPVPQDLEGDILALQRLDPFLLLLLSFCPGDAFHVHGCPCTAELGLGFVADELGVCLLVGRVLLHGPFELLSELA